MSVVALRSGETLATVNTEGAWLESLTFSDRPILFPKQTFTVGGTQKQRGGCHVCLPNFGPGGNSGQAQHGFGRIVSWEITGQAEESVELELLSGEGKFSALQSCLSYELGNTGLAMTLSVTNKGGEPLLMSPGFHPYFDTSLSQRVAVDDGERLDLNGLGEAQFVDGPEHALKVGGMVLRLSANNMPVWALWSDRLGNYVCLEPTASGNSFEQAATPELQPHESSEYGFSISWSETTQG